MNKEPYDTTDPEVCCAYCGQPLRIHIGYSITDVLCENDDCGLTNTSLATTDIKEIKKFFKEHSKKG